MESPWGFRRTGVETYKNVRIALGFWTHRRWRFDIFVLSFSWFYKKVLWSRVELQTQGKQLIFILKSPFVITDWPTFFIRAPKSYENKGFSHNVNFNKSFFPFRMHLKCTPDFWFSGGIFLPSDGWKRKYKQMLKFRYFLDQLENRVGRSHVKFQVLLFKMKSK